MDDATIVSLYWKRDEKAIKETELKYGKYLTKIAYGILTDSEDTKESVNDTYLKAWESMPPHKPGVLSTFLGKIVRRTSIDIFRKKTSKKRIKNEFALSLSELEDCISGNSTEKEADYNQLVVIINTFLRSLSPEVRRVFMGRYYFDASIHDIATSCGISESKVKTMLYRTRLLLKAKLEKEGS